MTFKITSNFYVDKMRNMRKKLVNGSEERKHYFLDTSSLMLNPLGIFKLASCRVDNTLVPRKTYSNIASVLDSINTDITSENPNNVYISEMVEWELNDIKDRKKYEDAESARQAMQVLSVLSHLKNYGRTKNEFLSSGITLPNGAKIFSVPHDEPSFMKYAAKHYEPTRDDRILFDYFTVAKLGLLQKLPNFIKKLSGQSVINIPSGSFVQVVTEDINFQGLVHDLVGKMGVDINCSSLMFERTKHPNPAEQYTGIYSRPLVISPENYARLFDSANIRDKTKSSHSVPLATLASSAINSGDFKDLDSIVMNQFVKISVSESPDGADSNIDFFMRRQQDRLVPLRHSAQFMEEEYKPRSSKSNLHKLVEADVNDVIYDKHKLLQLIKNETRLHNNQKNKLRKMINSSSREPEHFEDINAKYREFLKNNGKAASKEKTNMYTRQNILDTPFNPTVIPDSEQILFVEYLNDPSIGAVSFVAPQGAGKTYFALASGLRQVRMGLYDSIIYIRPIVETGQPMGFMPGKDSDKIRPYTHSSEDALEKIYSMRESPEFYRAHPHLRISDPTAFMKALQETGIINYQALTYMAGRTLSRAFVIMDESHLLNREQMRLFLGRIGESSKCVLLGDYAQLGAADADVIRKYQLTSDKLGLSHLIEKVLVKNNKDFTDIYGHISINRNYSKRSRVAGIGNLI